MKTVGLLLMIAMVLVYIVWYATSSVRAKAGQEQVLTEGNAAKRGNVTLRTFGQGADTSFGVEVDDPIATHAVVTVFYHSRLQAFPVLLLLSETEVIPCVDHLTVGAGPFRYRGDFVDIAWVHVTLVSQREEQTFKFGPKPDSGEGVQ